MKQLTSEERNFFQHVFQATFSNPFSPIRFELEKKILEKISAKDTPQIIRDKAIKKIFERINKLERNNKATLNEFEGEDRKLLKYVFLFEIYHKCIDHLDRYIEDQNKQSKPLTVSFSKDVFRSFETRGFNAKEKIQYFSFFYQLRRAFYFINLHIVGHSPSINRLKIQFWNNLFSFNIHYFEEYLWNQMEDFSLLILGETGTGKGSVAKAMGKSGFIPYLKESNTFQHHFNDTFLEINLSQFPQNLIESELFGHKKGAFTGALDSHQGVLSRIIPHGLLFLDEIGDTSIEIQLKLLQVIQERFFSPVGEKKKFRFNGRIIAATNRPIMELRQKGLFRNDFFYRLSSDIMELPSLKTRISEDSNELPILCENILHRLLGNHSKSLNSFILDSISKLFPPDYSWPGNVRELEQCIRRLLLQGNYSDNFQDFVPSHHNEEHFSTFNLTAQEMMQKYCRAKYKELKTIQKVATLLDLDKRTVKKYLSLEPKDL